MNIICKWKIPCEVGEAARERAVRYPWERDGSGSAEGARVTGGGAQALA